MLLALVACREPPRAVDGPTLVLPNARAPYARQLAWSFDRPVTVRGIATDGRHGISIASGPATDHVVPLLGLYPDAEWTVLVHAVDAEGAVVAAPAITFRTDPLPDLFPAAALRASSPDLAPGVTLTVMTSNGGPSYLVVFDEDGEVAWMYDNLGVIPNEALPYEGGVLYVDGTDIASIDWLGNQRQRLRSWSPYARPDGTEVVGAFGFNHDVNPTDAGTFLVVGTQVLNLPDYPLSYDDPGVRGRATVSSDTILEIDPETATIVRDWATWEHVDPHRIGWGSLDPSPVGFDWTHANAISARGDEWLVSLRHQDAVLLVHADSGEVEFILGNHDNWSPEFQDRLLEPIGPLEWPYHQHAAKWLAGDRVLLFDNGNFKCSPWTGEPKVDNEDTWSRVVQYHVDREARTVEQEWEFQLDPTVFSGAMGDADALPNGHVLATFAYVLVEGGVPNAALGRRMPSTRIVEFDPADGETLWDLDVWADLGSAAIGGWHSFRAERIARPDGFSR